MPFRLLVALLALVAAPLALLGWVSSTTMRRQNEVAREQMRTVLRSRLVEIDRLLSGVLDTQVRRISGKLDRPETVASRFRSLELTDPVVRQGIYIDAAGTMVYPVRPFVVSPDQLAFYSSLPAMVDARPNVLGASSDEPLQATVNSSADSTQSKGGVTSKSPTSRSVVRSQGSPSKSSLSLQQRESNTVAIGSPFWQVWYLDEGSQLVLWFPFSNGAAAGIMLERARWISDLTEVLPDTLSDSDRSRSASLRETQTPGFTALVDESQQVVYRWGDEGERTDTPIASIPLSRPLSSWRLEYHADESLFPQANSTPLYASLAGLAAALIGLGGYVLTSVQRQMRTARSRVTFAGQVSHELRTPLTNIQLYAELAESDLDSLPESQVRSKLTKRLGVIDTESRRLGRLVSGVLEMIRDDRKQREPKIVQANPDEWIDRTISQFEPSFQNAGIELHRNADAGDTVGFDPDILEMVLVNLLSNVEKYAANGKHVEVNSKLTDGNLVVAVRDRGPGIPKRHHRSVFRPFARLDDSISAPSGTGIGLTIAQRAANRHGGELALIPCDQGSHFELRLPVEY